MSTFRTLHPRVADNILNVADLAELNTIGDPQLGDIRFVVAEDTLYVYASGGWEVSGGGGGIQPPDPAVSTDNAVVLWDGTDASTLKNSATVINPTTGVTTGISIDADGSGNSITNIEDADIKAGAAINAGKIADGSVSNTEFQYLNGVTSAIQTQLTANATAISDHLSDTTDAHDASAISNVPSGNLAATDVQGALNELQGDVDNNATNLSNHISDTTDAHDASAISNIPAGNLIATDVQGALNELQSDVDGRQLTSEKGVANGYASLDGGGKVPVAQLPATLMTYEGTWDASTNTPTLANGTGDAGMVYIVNVAGTVNFGAGPITFAVGDWVIYNGTIWQKSDNADDVVSVNGLTGVVTLNAAAVDAIAEMGTVVNHRLVKTQGTTGGTVEQTGVTVNNSNHMSGVNQLDVDNVRVDGNTVSATSGDLTLNAGANVVNLEGANVFIRGGADLAFYDNDNSNAIVISVPNNVTTNRTPQIPDDTGNFVLTSAAQSITAKDIDGGTASDTSRLTVPKASKATLDALTRKEATVVFASDEDKLYVDDGTNLVAVGSGIGTGEVNLLTSGINDAIGWTTTGANAPTITTTTTAGDLPLGPGVGTALKLSSSTSAGSETVHYASRAFTIPETLKNSKLNVKLFIRPGANFLANEWSVSIYDNTTRVTLSTDSSSLSYLPNGNLQYTASFDTGSTTAYTIRITRLINAGTNVAVLNVANVIVGPGQIVNAAPIGPWESYTPVMANTGSKIFTCTARWRRVGDSMEIVYLLDGNTTASGSAAGTAVTMTIPTGYTIDSTKDVGGITYGAYTSFGIETAATYDIGYAYGSTSTTIRFGSTDGVGDISIGDLNAARDMDIQGRVTIPISEWAGSPNYAGQNDVEWASSTTGTWDAAAAAVNTVYGPQGSPITANLTADRDKVVRFLTPVQATDDLELFLIDPNGKPAPASLKIPLAIHVTVDFGPRIVSISGTDVTIRFNQFAVPGTVYNNTTGAVGWLTALGAGYSWVLRKSRAGAAVGFGAATSTSSGLLQPPTSIEDVKATQMGLKTYAHGTNYNGGNAPTITLSSGGGTLSSIAHSAFLPYQTQSGTWRLKGQFTAVTSATARTAPVFALAGATISASYDQPVFATANPGVGMTRTRIQNPFSLSFDHNSISTTQYYVSFDVELTAKPTWAY